MELDSRKKPKAEEFFFVEKILGYDRENNLYHIKWQHYTETTWEPPANFLNPALLHSYHSDTGTHPRGDDAAATGTPLGPTAAATGSSNKL